MRLHGRICRGADPVEGAYVQLIGPSGDFTAEVRTDESGRFLFYPVAGSWQLRASVPGGEHASRNLQLAEGQTLDVVVDIAGAALEDVPTGA